MARTKKMALTEFARNGLAYFLRQVGPLFRHVPQPTLDPALGRGAGGYGAVGVLLPLGLGVAGVAGSGVRAEVIFPKSKEQTQALVDDRARLVNRGLADAALVRPRLD